MEKQRSSDSGSYMRFTGPQRLHKAVSTLVGLLEGVALDGTVNEAEASAIIEWVSAYEEFAAKHPFSEILPPLLECLSRAQLDEDVREDLLWLCRQTEVDNPYYEYVTETMQQLHGVLAGVVADGQINELELRGLKRWLDRNRHLRSCWPYDEITSLVRSVMADGHIDPEEHQQLLQFFGAFSQGTSHRLDDAVPENHALTVIGICAAEPDVQFDGRLFCFTGKSARCVRAAIADTVVSLGGRFADRVTRDLDYLVVGADGNPCWAFSCYGRKVEQAVVLRKQGIPVVLTHEEDFWRAVSREGGAVPQ